MKNAVNPQKLLISILVVMFCMAGVAAAEEENYYLEQMRKQSQSDSNTPEQAMPEQDNGLIAETDLENLAKTTDSLADIDNVTPKFDKPKLELFKPEL